MHVRIILSPNLRRGLEENFVAKSGILGFLILFGRFLYEKKILDWVTLSKSVQTMKKNAFFKMAGVSSHQI